MVVLTRGLPYAVAVLSGPMMVLWWCPVVTWVQGGNGVKVKAYDLLADQ